MIQKFEFSSPADFLNRLGKDFQTLVNPAITSKGRAHVALSGGSTPKPFYAHLNQTGLVQKPIVWWLGDERWVPVDHEQSNERMIRESLGKDIADFSSRFQTWRLSDEPSKAAELYEEKLCQNMGVPPAFDLVLLGVGTDGHTASLFPGTSALKESTRFAVSNAVPQQNGIRVTLTYPTLNAAKEVWFLISGKDKQPMVQRLLNRDETIPSARVKAAHQKLYWLL